MEREGEEGQEPDARATLNPYLKELLKYKQHDMSGQKERNLEKDHRGCRQASETTRRHKVTELFCDGNVSTAAYFLAPLPNSSSEASNSVVFRKCST